MREAQKKQQFVMEERVTEVASENWVIHQQKLKSYVMIIMRRSRRKRGGLGEEGKERGGQGGGDGGRKKQTKSTFS